MLVQINSKNICPNSYIISVIVRNFESDRSKNFPKGSKYNQKNSKGGFNNGKRKKIQRK